MMTACKKEEKEMPTRDVIYKDSNLALINPSFKLIESQHEENGNIGKLYRDMNNPMVTMFVVEQSTKQLLYKGHWHSYWQGNNYVATCSKCNNCEHNCRVDATLNDKGEIVAIKITRME